MAVQSAKELTAYEKAHAMAMRVFKLSKRFSAEERFGLTSQVRRSSGSVCNNLREAWAKHRYPSHFVSKLTDCDGVSNETGTSLDFARDSGYLTKAEHRELTAPRTEIGKMFGSMINTLPHSP